MTDEEFQAILSHIPTQDAADVAEFFIFSLNQGTRRRETFNLRWNDIDLAQYKLTLPHHKTEAYDSEAGGQIRTLTQAAHQQLQRLKKKYVAAHDQPPDPNAHIFTRYQTESTYSKIFTKAAKAAGLRDIRFHDLRHEATTRISHQCRHNSTLTKSYTGHKDERSLARYSHASPREIHNTVQQLQARDSQSMHRDQHGNYPSGFVLPNDNPQRHIDFLRMMTAACGDDRSKAMISEFLRNCLKNPF